MCPMILLLLLLVSTCREPCLTLCCCCARRESEAKDWTCLGPCLACLSPVPSANLTHRSATVCMLAPYNKCEMCVIRPIRWLIINKLGTSLDIALCLSGRVIRLLSTSRESMLPCHAFVFRLFPPHSCLSPLSSHLTTSFLAVSQPHWWTTLFQPPAPNRSATSRWCVSSCVCARSRGWGRDALFVFLPCYRFHRSRAG